MRYLVDTNAWIGFFEGRRDFGINAKRVMSEYSWECAASIASIWEAAIKIGIGKLKLPYDLETDLPGLMDRNGFEILPISISAATSVKNLPSIHADPFDRIMVAQAKKDGLDIVSSDPIFESYGLRRIW